MCLLITKDKFLDTIALKLFSIFKETEFKLLYD